MEKLLPQNIEAESGVLGSIIIDPEAIVQVADFLMPEDFYRDGHRTIYETILQLYEMHEAADFITICDELARKNKLEEVGGPGYITSLINQVPTSGNIEYYGRIVERTAILRRLIHASGQIAAVAYEEADANVALDTAEKLIFGISQRHARADFSPLSDLLTDYMAKLDQLHEHRGTIVGVPTGFTDLDRLTGGLQRSDLIILAARPAVGKCMAAWTLIDDPATGERLTIEECVKRRLPAIHGLSEEGKVRITDIGDWIDSGIQPCFRVTTHSGRRIEVTGHHPFLSVDGWTPLHDLYIGQSIAVPTAVPAFGSDESWPLEKVRLLAYFIAEGGLTSTSPRFTNTDPVIVEDFKSIIATHFPACQIKQYGIDYAVAQPASIKSQYGFTIPKNPVTLWLKELGLMGKLSKDKFFPLCVWKWSRRYLAEFLRALLSCDGSIYANAEGCPRIEFSVASQQLAADVFHALVRFGIGAKFYKKSDNVWRVAITNLESVKKYQDEINWIGEKIGRFAAYQHIVSLRIGNIGHAPPETWELVRNGAKREGIALIEMARRGGETTGTGKYAGYNPHAHRSIPRYRLAAYAKVLQDPDLQKIASEDIYWDEIVSIEPIGEHQVYDLTVPDGANFVAQDVFVHNTSLGLSLAHNAAVKHGQSIAVFSLEMSKEQLVQRLLSMDAGIDQQRLRTGWIEDDEWERIIFAMGTLAEANIWIDDTAGISPMEMRSKARRLQAEHGIDLIIVDYLQLMQSTVGGKRNENRVQEISEISRNLKGLARELNIPVMALAQLSRAVESRQSKVPQLSDLRESGCLAGETLVYLPDSGEYRRIDSLIGTSGFSVLALNTQTQKLEPKRATNAFSTGRKPVFRMTTRLGHVVRATANHKFLAFNRWTRLDEIVIGTCIALPSSITTSLPLRSNNLLSGGGRDHVHGVRNLTLSTSSPCKRFSSPSTSYLDEVDHEALLLDEIWRRENIQQPQGFVATRSMMNNGGAHDNRKGLSLCGERIESDIYWDEVVSIEEDGEEEVYDLTVSELHNFVANNIVVHNSIEQDADVVMFIYREDVYNPDTERKNIADIIVAKHRNGPVGEVSLYFQASQTRFSDLEVSPPTEE